MIRAAISRFHNLSHKLSNSATHAIEVTEMEPEPRPAALDRMYAQLLDAHKWIGFAQSALASKPWSPDTGEAVLIGSDYAGQTKKSGYLTYAFVICTRRTWDWDEIRRDFRKNSIPDNRRLSFKKFGKSNNPMALEYFLDLTRFLHGHLVVFAFEKNLVRRLPPIRPDERNFSLEGRWKPAALEEATRKALLLALLSDQYVPQHCSMDWITDDDPSIANDLMLSDVQKMAATLTGAFSSTPRGFFAMGTTGRDCKHMYREDFVAIADFAAGMVADVTTHLADQPLSGPVTRPTKTAKFDTLSPKTQVIARWFWHSVSDFKKTCLLIEGTENQGRVVELLS